MIAQALRQSPVSQRPPLAAALFFPPSAATHALAGAMDDLGIAFIAERNRQIYGEQEPAVYFYRVVTGLVRTCTFLADGRRQIGSFHFPGETFGFAPGAAHGLSAEAVERSRLVAVKRTVLAAASGRDAGLSTALLQAATRELHKAQEHVVLLGRKSAAERILAFLRGLRRRDPDAAILRIPMSRHDIADYLGLTIETVSRTFSHLEHDGVIAFEGARRLRLCGPL